MKGPLTLAMLFALPLRSAGQSPVALADSDFTVGRVAYGQDSSEVRRILGSPMTKDSTLWRYAGIRIWFHGSKVHQIEITGRRYRTRRGLRIGDPVARASALYGPSCTEGAYNYCRTVGDEPDERGILLFVQKGRVTGIRVGAVFDLD